MKDRNAILWDRKLLRMAKTLRTWQAAEGEQVTEKATKNKKKVGRHRTTIVKQMPDDGLAIKDPVLKRCHRSGRWPTLNSIKQRKRSIWKPNIHRTAVIGCGTDLYSGRWATVKKSDAKWKTNFEHSTNDQIRYGRVTIMNHYHHHHHYRSVLSSRTSPSDRCSPPLLWQITIKNIAAQQKWESKRKTTFSRHSSGTNNQGIS